MCFEDAGGSPEVGVWDFHESKLVSRLLDVSPSGESTVSHSSLSGEVGDSLSQKEVGYPLSGGGGFPPLSGGDGLAVSQGGVPSII